MNQQKNVFITIHSVQGYGEQDAEEMDFETDGTYSYGEDLSMLSYEESEVTGMEGTTTTMSFENGAVTVDRMGTVSSTMLFREGMRDAFLYSTPYGNAKLGIDTKKVTGALNACGGRVEIDYIVNMEHLVAVRNRLTVDIREQGAQQ